MAKFAIDSLVRDSNPYSIIENSPMLIIQFYVDSNERYSKETIKYTRRE